MNRLSPVDCRDFQETFGTDLGDVLMWIASREMFIAVETVFPDYNIQELAKVYDPGEVFGKEAVKQWVLDMCSDVLSPGKEAKDYVASMFLPEDVFDFDELVAWAEKHDPVSIFGETALMKALGIESNPNLEWDGSIKEG